MMDMPKLLQDQLARKRDDVIKARRTVELMEAELRGFEAALQLIVADKPTADRLSFHQADRLAERDGRGISEQWRSIFAATAEFWPRPASLDEIMQIAERLDTPINRNTLRSQASVYSDRGLLERVGQGSYRLTREGAVKLGARIPQPGDVMTAPEGGSVTFIGPAPDGAKLSDWTSESETASPDQEDAAS